MRGIVAAWLLLALTQTQAPPRDAPPSASAAAGTATIRGRVVAADDASPIRHALVTVNGRALGRASGVTIYTDTRGRFEVKNLPAGEYVVRPAPNQYQGQFLQSGMGAPVAPPPKVTIADGQAVDVGDLTLNRAGAITGRIIDDAGDPISGVSVTPQRIGDRAGSGYAQQSSDEFGRYRLFRLVPGDYRVTAKPSSGGDYVGEGQAAPRFVETVYPRGTPRGEGRLRVRARPETAAADLVLVRARMLRVRGILLDSHGAPASKGAMISLAQSSSSTGMGLPADGRFSFRPQQPGKYSLIGQLRDENEAIVEYVNVPLDLADSDIDDVIVTMKPTANVVGHVVFDGTPPPTLNPQAITISTQALSIGENYQLSRSASVNADLTFALRHVAGQRLIRAAAQFGTWTIKAVLLGEQDITDVPTEFRDTDSGRLQVVLTNRASQLTGNVTNEKGQPAAGMQVLVFSEDRALWFGSSTRVRMDRSDAGGTYTVRGLRGGRYLVVALPPDRMLDDRSIDVRSLEALVPEATTIVIGEDDQRQLDLRVSSRPGGH